jgi:hypothetical protein
MGWEASMLDVMLELLNTFLTKGIDIYFGHKDKVYVINKQLIIDVFRVCAEGYVKELNGQVSIALVVQRVSICHNLSNILPLYLPFIRGKRHNMLPTKILLY